MHPSPTFAAHPHPTQDHPRWPRLQRALALGMLCAVAACGGGGTGNNAGASPGANAGANPGAGGDPGANGDSTGAPAALAEVQPTLNFSREFAELSWPPVAGATQYKVYQTQAGQQELVSTSATPQASVPISVLRAHGVQYVVQACRGADSASLVCGPLANPVAVEDHLEALHARAVDYVKAPQSAEGAQFGSAVALSADGSTLAVGVPADPKVPDSFPVDQAAPGAPFGAVYLFDKNAAGWRLTQTLSASDGLVGDRFGAALALSADGSTLAVGAPMEASAGRGVDADKDFNFDAKPSVGAVYVYTRRSGVFTDEVYLKASGFTSAAPLAIIGTGMQFGTALALSAHGDTLAVGAVLESTASAGPNRSANRSRTLSGAAFVYVRSQGQWSEQSLIKAPNPGDQDQFGAAVALSADGNTLAVGAPNEDGSSTVVDGPFDELLADSGAVYVYRREAGRWAASSAYLKPSRSHALYRFGSAVALSEDGSNVLVGAPGDGLASLGGGASAGGSDAGAALAGSGAAYVFTLASGTWAQSAYLKAPRPSANASLGAAVRLADQGRTIVVGAPGESSAVAGDSGSPADTAAPGAGAVLVFRLVDGAWVVGAHLRAGNPSVGAAFGSGLAVRADGNGLAVGAPQESGCARGLVADLRSPGCSTTVPGSGAMYLY